MDDVKIWKPRKGLDVKRFAAQNREIVRNLAIVLVVVFVACLITGLGTAARLKRKYRVELNSEVARVEQEVMARMREQYGVNAAEMLANTIDEEAKSLAKMLYPMQYNTDEGLMSACWCAINRVGSRWYPDTIQEVCEQKDQWMGWSNENPVIERLYNIASEQLRLWHNGVHAIGTDFVFLSWTSKEITLRTTYEGGSGCHYWYEEDWA